MHTKIKLIELFGQIHYAHEYRPNIWCVHDARDNLLFLTMKWTEQMLYKQ